MNEATRVPAGLLDFVGVDERQKRTLSAIVGGLIGSVVAGFAVNALLNDPMVVWISVAVSFVVFEAVLIYMVNTRVAVGQKSVLRPGAPKPRWFLRLLHIAGWFFVFIGALSFVGHVLVSGSGRNSRAGRVRRVDPGRDELVARVRCAHPAEAPPRKRRLVSLAQTWCRPSSDTLTVDGVPIQRTAQDALRPADEPNRIRIDCVGGGHDPTIVSGWINGQPILSVAVPDGYDSFNAVGFLLGAQSDGAEFVVDDVSAAAERPLRR